MTRTLGDAARQDAATTSDDELYMRHAFQSVRACRFGIADCLRNQQCRIVLILGPVVRLCLLRESWASDDCKQRRRNEKTSQIHARSTPQAQQFLHQPTLLAITLRGTQWVFNSNG